MTFKMRFEFAILSSAILTMSCSATVPSYPPFEIDYSTQSSASSQTSVLSAEQLERRDQKIELDSLEAEAPTNSVTIFQINDVYEVEPSEAGTRGGIARVATIRKKLEQQNPAFRSKDNEVSSKRVLSVLPGDFISPSAIGSAIEIKNGTPVYKVINGKRVPQPIAGRHMVEALRAAGMDLVSFGNHEFDYKNSDPQFADQPPQVLLNRIQEFTRHRPLSSKFYGTLAYPRWLAGNVQLKGKESSKLLKTSREPFIWKTNIRVDGQVVPIKVGVIAICLPLNTRYAMFEGEPNSETQNIFVAARRQIKILESQGVHAIVAMTHQSMEDDLKFAQEFKNKIHLISGGHEHDRQSAGVFNGENPEIPLMITKADANAKSAFIHRLTFKKANGVIKLSDVKSSWMEVNNKIESDPFVRQVTSKAESEAKASYRKFPLTATESYAPDRVIWNTVNSLDGRESKIRSQKTLLSELLGRSLAARAYRAQKAQGQAPENLVVGTIYHGGTIRIDDQLMSSEQLQKAAPEIFNQKLKSCKLLENCPALENRKGLCEKKERCPGEVTEYDVLRIMPFEGSYMTWIALTGRQIDELYHCNDQNSGTGSYLQFSNFYPCKGKTGLCYRIPNPASAEFALTNQEAFVEPNKTYTVASMDYLTHVAFKKHPILKDASVVIFPTSKQLEDLNFKKSWVLENDVRRAIIEEPAKVSSWAESIISDKKVSEAFGYGPQIPSPKAAAKNPRCAFN